MTALGSTRHASTSASHSIRKLLRSLAGIIGIAVIVVSCSGKETSPVADTTVASDSVSLSQPSSPDLELSLLDKIGGNTTRADLVARFGADNVTDTTIYFVDGVTEPGSVLFVTDSSRRVEITWRDSVTKSRPGLVRLYGTASAWKFPHGITLGMTMSELERLNGRPFELMGFGWDYGGGISNWKGGALEDLTKSTPAITLRLNPKDPAPNEVSGERELSSDMPILKRLNPVVDRIMVTYELPSS